MKQYNKGIAKIITIMSLINKNYRGHISLLRTTYFHFKYGREYPQPFQEYHTMPLPSSTP